MASIPTQLPKAALRQAISLLEEAGGDDKVVSRADAEALVEQLRSSGDASSAAAVEQLFELVDGLDDKKGARVTGYDLDAVSSFVEKALLEQQDIDGDGLLSDAERAQLPAVGKALVEMGRAMAMEPPRGRMSHSVPARGVAHVAALVKAAGGDNAITSRAEAKALVDELQATGRHAEAAAVDAFFAMADDLTNLRGERVKAGDIDVVADLVEEHIRAADGNKNGLSRAELAGLSGSMRAMVMVGQMVDAGIVAPA